MTFPYRCKSFVNQVSQKWISIYVTLGLHRNYIYKEVPQNQNFLFCDSFVHRHYLYLLSNEDDNNDDNEDEKEDNLINGVRKKNEAALKGNKILLSLAPILKQTLLAQIKQKNLFLQIFFFLMLAQEYIFILRNFLFLEEQTKNEDNITSASYLHLLDLCQHLLSQTKWS